MIYIGNHLSASKGFLAMGKAISALGGNTFAFFTRNPRGGSAKEIDPKDVEQFLSYKEERGIGELVAHAPYTMNLCSQDAGIREFALNMFIDDIERMECVPGNYYNFHPGSHTGQGVDVGIDYIVDAINRALDREIHTTVLLETMAGKGSEIGSSFEELKIIIDRVEHKEALGVCFDTCHVWEAGYDIVNDFDGVLKEFDKVIGLDLLKAVHFNDSKNSIGAHKDRHEKIGEGCIGLDTMKYIATHEKLEGKPFILETPNDDPGYAKEIEMIKSWFE